MSDNQSAAIKVLEQLVNEHMRGPEWISEDTIDQAVRVLEQATECNNKPTLTPETLQALIDFAHAAMEKRPHVEADFVVTQSRKHTGGVAPLTAKDMRAIQQLGKPSWFDQKQDYYPG